MNSRSRLMQGATIAALVVLFTSPASFLHAEDYTLTNVAAQAGVEDRNHQRWGGTWVDYNGDGWMDLYPINGDGMPGDPEDENTLFRNNRDGTFTDVTDETGTGDPWIAMRNVWGDYDRDGDLDLYSHNFAQSTLYQNNGNVFTDVNETSGAGIEMPNGTGAAWVDYDNNGWLDLHATGFPDSWNVLLRNNRDGTFTDVQSASGMNFFASAMGNAWADFDRDGDQDVALAAVTAEDQTYFYINNGDGTFTDATAQVGIRTAPGSSGSAVYWADYDNDGWLDLVLTEVQVGSQKTIPLRLYLFRNKGDGTFEEVTREAGLLPPAGSDPLMSYWDVAFADYDNDGDQDLFVAIAKGRNLFYRNNGDGTFTEIGAALGVDQAIDTKGILWADYDNDGDIDFYVVRIDGFTHPNELLRNEGGPNHWLQVKLVGTCGNRDAIGAQIVAISGSRTQVREINGGTGLFAQHSPIQHFGLGSDGVVARLRIRWPSGGGQQILRNVQANQRITVVESSSCPGQALSAVTGNLTLQDEPAAERPVSLAQSNEPLQTTTTDADGIFVFDTAVSGKPADVIIGIPPLLEVPTLIFGCLTVGEDPLIGADVAFRQLGQSNRPTTTDAAGCYVFNTAIPDTAGTIFIKIPIVP